MSNIHLTFLGAAGTVTGSKYLLELENKHVLIDCGLFQGKKEIYERNWMTLPIHPAKIDAVIITHAHLDHTGYIPLLVKDGYTGPIYATPGTIELCKIVLPDSGRIQEEKQQFSEEHSSKKHPAITALYTEKDAQNALKQFVAVSFDQTFSFAENCYFHFSRAAHILGAASIYFTYNTKTLLFSGDLGRLHDAVMREPAAIQAANFIIMESTYGDRVHNPINPQVQLAAIINDTIAQQGTLVIPAFAVGRTQSILYFISQLKEQRLIPADIPIYLDSPMAEQVTQLYTRYIDEHKLGPEHCVKLTEIATTVSNTTEMLPVPAVIISASGMATGGRILHHLKTFAPHSHNTLLFTGYQAEETLGAEITQGKRHVKIHGEPVTIHGQVKMLENMSAHADSEEILTWLSQLKQAPRQVFITHGEPDSALALKQKIEKKLHWHCMIPAHLQKVNLSL